MSNNTQITEAEVEHRTSHSTDITVILRIYQDDTDIVVECWKGLWLVVTHE